MTESTEQYALRSCGTRMTWFMTEDGLVEYDEAQGTLVLLSEDCVDWLCRESKGDD